MHVARQSSSLSRVAVVVSLGRALTSRLSLPNAVSARRSSSAVDIARECVVKSGGIVSVRVESTNDEDE
jgi:hypothetical protein